MEARYKLLKEDPSDKNPISKSNKMLYIGLTFALVFLISHFHVQYTPAEQFTVEPHGAIFDTEGVLQCPSALPPPASPPAPVNLWASLDLEDAVQIRQWLHAPERMLNLTRVDTRYVSSDNMLYNLEAYYPSKAEALAYLGSPSSVPRPDRYARVTIHHGARLEPVVKDYLVGPLPVSSRTEMHELTSIYHRNDIPFHARGIAINNEIVQFLVGMMAPLADATKVSVARFHLPTLN
jgi:primary-amine oxidase